MPGTKQPGHTSTSITAGNTTWLHGTVEDAQATPGDIEMESGNALVEEPVEALTDVSPAR